MTSLGLRSGTNDHDLALLHLCSPVRWRPQVQPVCLPQPGDITHHEGGTALVSGWGTTTSGQNTSLCHTKINIFFKFQGRNGLPLSLLFLGGKQPNSLMVANVTIIPHGDCEKVRIHENTLEIVE